MKKSILAIIVLATISAHAQNDKTAPAQNDKIAPAQSDKYVAAMRKNLQLLDSAQTTEQLAAVSLAFERIGDAEKNQWLPYYYAAFAQTRIGFNDSTSNRDAIGQKANELAAKGEAIEKNADLCSIHNMAATIQLLVNPMERWKTYGAQAYSALQEGHKLDPGNPRLYFLEGASLFNKPEFVGGGKDKAKPVFEKAVQLFHAEKVTDLYPNWGLEETEAFLAKCK